MEDTEVDQGIGGNKEVGEEGGDNVELGDENTADSNNEDEDVAPDWIIVGSPSGREELNFGIKFVLGQSLQDPGGSHQAGNGRTDSCGEAASVDEVAGDGDQGHGLLVVDCPVQTSLVQISGHRSAVQVEGDGPAVCWR